MSNIIKDPVKHKKFWDTLNTQFIHRELEDWVLDEIVEYVNDGRYICSHNMSEKGIKNNFIGYYFWDAYDINASDRNPHIYFRRKLISREQRNEYVKNIGMIYRTKYDGKGNKVVLQFKILSKKDYDKIKERLCPPQRKKIK